MTLNVAMIGTGRIAGMQLAPALAQTANARLWSVLSRDRARADAFAAEHAAGAPDPAYDSLQALLEDPALDAVVVATPDRLHAEQAIAAASAGKHVLTEKPMAASLAECEAMQAAAAAHGVRLGLAYHLRWHAGHRALHAAVREGAIGQPRHMRVQWPTMAADADGWRASAEVGRWWSLAAVGTHCLDLVRWFMRPRCGEVRELRSVINTSAMDSAHDQTAVVSLQFDDGATAEICSSVLFRGPMRVELYGSEGHALGEDTLGAEGAGAIVLNDQPLDFEVANPFVGEIEDFAAAVLDGRAPEVDGAEGAHNVALLEQAFPRAG